MSLLVTLALNALLLNQQAPSQESVDGQRPPPHWAMMTPSGAASSSAWVCTGAVLLLCAFSTLQLPPAAVLEEACRAPTTGQAFHNEQPAMQT